MPLFQILKIVLSFPSLEKILEYQDFRMSESSQFAVIADTRKYPSGRTSVQVVLFSLRALMANIYRFGSGWSAFCGNLLLINMLEPVNQSFCRFLSRKVLSYCIGGADPLCSTESRSTSGTQAKVNSCQAMVDFQANVNHPFVCIFRRKFPNIMFITIDDPKCVTYIT